MSGADQGKPDLDALIAQCIATTEEYERTFRNLVAEETKVIELYRASGEVEKRREIVSDLVVYRSSRAESGAATEFRDVRSVDGKSIEKRRDRALKLLAEASGAESIEQELRTIDRKTARHEIKGHLRGFTVRQFAVRPNWRETHHVEWAGREQIAGRDVVMLNYRLRRPDTRSRFPLPREIRNPAYIQRGRIWLDAETGQLRRAVWEIAVAHPDAAEPLALVHCDSFYTPSPFGILVPERIVFDWLLRYKHPKNGAPSFTLSERATFTYGAFKRFDVATSESIR